MIKNRKLLKIDTALSPSDVHLGHLDQVCIVIDVLRASSTLTTLLHRGCSRVYTVETVREARLLAKSEGLILETPRLL